MLPLLSTYVLLAAIKPPACRHEQALENEGGQMQNNKLFALLMLLCSSANAAVYSCVDETGAKVLKSMPCESNEKQQEIRRVIPPSYIEIHSTGQRQSMYGALERHQSAKAEAARDEEAQLAQEALFEEQKSKRIAQAQIDNERRLNDLRECRRTGLCDPSEVRLLMSILTLGEITSALGAPHHKQAFEDGSEYLYFQVGANKYQIILERGMLRDSSKKINVY